MNLGQPRVYRQHMRHASHLRATNRTNMRPFSTAIALLFTVFIHAQAFNWQWSVTATSTETSGPNINGMTTDGGGNSYLTGSFYGTATFSDLPPVTAGLQGDLYVVKYDADGTALWVVHTGGDSFDEAMAVSVDGAGNVYITGYFQSTSIDFGAGPLVRSGLTDIFVAKYSADGVFQWAKRYGSNSTQLEMDSAIVAEDDGDVHVTGIYRNTLEVPGQLLLESCMTREDMFLMKLDTDGNALWSKRPGCTNDDSYGALKGDELTLDAFGNLYVGARLRGDTVFFETDTVLNDVSGNQAEDGILAKYDADGNFQWARGFGGYGYDEIKALETDADGNCYLAVHRESAYILPELTLDVSGTLGIYCGVLLKSDPDGVFAWGARMGNNGYNTDLNGLVLDDEGRLFAGGQFSNRCEWDGIVSEVTPGAFYGAFIAQYDQEGVAQEVWVTRQNLPRTVNGLGRDQFGNLYTAGGFHDTLTFAGTPTLDVEDQAIYLARSGDINTGLVFERMNGDGVQAYPVPSDGALNVRSEQPFTGLRIVNALGSEVVQDTFPPTVLHNVHLPQSGVFFYALYNGAEPVGTGRVVIQR